LKLPEQTLKQIPDTLAYIVTSSAGLARGVARYYASVAEGTLQPDKYISKAETNCDYVPLDTFTVRRCIVRQAHTRNPWIPEACAPPSSNTHPPREVRQLSAVEINEISFWCFLLFPPYFKMQLFYRDRVDTIVDRFVENSAANISIYVSLRYIYIYIYTGCGKLTSFFIWVYSYKKGS
jgi:hypothetical protein